MSTNVSIPSTRPARKQVPAPVLTQSDKDKDVNLWSGRRLGPRPESKAKAGRQRSKYQCNPKMDSGRTRGDLGQTNQFCLYFARGLCAEGADCRYLHRLPTELDEAKSMAGHSNDIFGRPLVSETEHGREYRGPTAQQRSTRTLYVNYGGACHYDVVQLRRMVEDSFLAWGPLQGVFIARSKGLAFVKFQWRTSAEFAKEAMEGQGLVGSELGEVLAVRWAHDDEAPGAVVQRKRDAELALGSAMLAGLDNLPPEVKRMRLMQLQMGMLQQSTAFGGVNGAVSDYPDTDGQYPDAPKEEPDVSYDPAELGLEGAGQQGSAGQGDGPTAAAAAAVKDWSGKEVQEGLAKAYDPAQLQQWYLHQQQQYLGQQHEAQQGDASGAAASEGSFAVPEQQQQQQQHSYWRQQGQYISIAALSAAGDGASAHGVHVGCASGQKIMPSSQEVCLDQIPDRQLQAAKQQQDRPAVNSLSLLAAYSSDEEG